MRGPWNDSRVCGEEEGKEKRRRVCGETGVQVWTHACPAYGRRAEGSRRQLALGCWRVERRGGRRQISVPATRAGKARSAQTALRSCMEGEEGGEVSRRGHWNLRDKPRKSWKNAEGAWPGAGEKEQVKLTSQQQNFEKNEPSYCKNVYVHIHTWLSIFFFVFWCRSCTSDGRKL